MRINIPSPCSEDWDNMNPAAQGRFCTSCQKTVVDFTAMSDNEVKQYLLRNIGQQTCGRFYQQQLQRPLQDEVVTVDKRWFDQLPYNRQLFYAVTLFFLVGIAACNFSDTPKAPSLLAGKPPATTMTLGAPVAVVDTAKKPTIIKPPLVPDNSHCITKGDVRVEEPSVVGKIAPPVETIKEDTVALPVPPDNIIMGGIPVPFTDTPMPTPKVSAQD